MRCRVDNLYWPIYKKLESELLSMTSKIRFDDKQLKVYSDDFLDILLRTSVEIEAISKELYLKNGGCPIVPANEMYFDTICLDYLEHKWNLSKKVVLISSISLYFEQEENRILTPLKKANRRGTSGSKWKKAYQAVKHNRSESYTEGNMKNCINALAALYVLNIYYKDEYYELRQDEINGFDQTLGSDVFSVIVNKGNSFSGEMKDDKSAVYCINYTSEFVEKWAERQIKLNQYIYEQICKDRRLIDAINAGSITVEELGDIRKIQNIIGTDDFSGYLSNATKKININQILAEREYCAYTNKQ